MIRLKKSKDFWSALYFCKQNVIPSVPKGIFNPAKIPDRVEAQVLYSEYCVWCLKTKTEQSPQIVFNRQIQKLFPDSRFTYRHDKDLGLWIGGPVLRKDTAL